MTKTPDLITPDLINLYEAAGFNPPFNQKNVSKIKANSNNITLKSEIRKALRILDEQNAINRFTWYNLPNGLDGQLIERILYYKGQGAFFYSDVDEMFYFLPYALNGAIDVYGRFKKIVALPFNGTSENPIQAFSRDVVYSINEIKKLTPLDGCVLLSDYSKQISQTNISRQMIQEPILDAMAEALPFARTSLIANSGIKGIRVGSDDEAASVVAACNSITKAATEGKPWVPIVANLEFQDLTNGPALKSEEYLLYMQALDNLRLSFYGIENGGLFQKKAHMLEAEQKLNNGNVGLILQDSLTLRQNFCDLVNSIWGLGIWVEPSEVVLNIDRNGDGMIGDDSNNEFETTEEEQNVEVENDWCYRRFKQNLLWKL